MFPYGRENRNNIVSNIKNNFYVDTMETIVISYKIKDLLDKKQEISYCLAYLGISEKTGYYSSINPSDFKYIDSPSTLFFEAISPSGSSISKDGEYRSILLNWDSVLIHIMKKDKLKKLYEEMREFIFHTLKDRKYFLLVEYFFPTDRIRLEYQFEAEVIAMNNKINFFFISWFNFYFSYHYSVISSHINEIFSNLMLKYEDSDHALFKEMIEKYGADNIFEMMYIFNNFFSPGEKTNITQKFKLGQKIIPLNLLEAQNPFNISYSTWKEYFISRKVSDLVVNNVTPGFALFAGYTFIKTTKSIYDNAEHKDRIERSLIAEKITEMLTQAQTYTYHHITERRNPVSGNTSWLSTEFKKLYYMIKDAISHTKDTIIMSNVSIAIFTEYLGRTIYDSAKLTKNSQHFQKYMLNIVADKHYNNFRRYMFELCYNLMCLNTKTHVIHGDLHLNNVILNLIIYIRSTQLDVEGRRICYKFGENKYIFDFNFYYISLIDFSRSIVNYKFAEDLRDKSIPSSFPFIGNPEDFQRCQVKMLLHYILSYKPIYEEKKHMLEDMITNNFQCCFKLLSVIDIYGFTLKFLEYLGDSPESPKTKKLLMEINKFADEMLSVELQEIIELGNFDEIKKKKWPNERIINRFFADEINNGKEEVVDSYDFNAPVAKSLEKYQLWPDYLKSPANEKYEEKQKKIDSENFKIINIIMKRQREKHP